MGPLQWLFDHLCDPLVKYKTKTYRQGRTHKAWVLQTHNERPWIWFIIKFLVAVITLVGIACGIYAAWQGKQGNKLAEEGNKLAKAGVQATLKQTCESKVSTRAARATERRC